MANEEINNTEETNENQSSVTGQTNTGSTAADTGADDEQSSGEMDFGAILEQFEQEQTAFSSGELVHGKVVGVSERGILVDFGYKSEGLIAPEEFTSPDRKSVV